MAKKSSIEKNNRRRRLVKKFAAKRLELLTVANDMTKEMEERFEARVKLAELPRNSAPTRIRNRCEITGRPRALLPQARHVAHRAPGARVEGPDPGLVKSSW
jgi:small subunit ribosomal protein S14